MIDYERPITKCYMPKWSTGTCRCGSSNQELADGLCQRCYDMKISMQSDGNYENLKNLTYGECV